MIPRLHPRGQSFRGACSYVLHDADRAKTNERVGWAMTVNLATKDVKWAWHEMTDTYNAQGALKAASGHDLRGRKNTKPVLHYTLAWAESDNPSPEEMQKAALASLKALGLSEHEALIAAHQDKKHLHVHIVVNTVHPQTGLTAPLKFTKLELSKWAEAYERENGIHCEERIKNNAERERAAKARTMDASAVLMGKRHDADRLLKAAAEVETPRRKPYVPIPHKSPTRKIWLDRKDVVDRMKRLRAEQEIVHKIDRNNSWERHKAERKALEDDHKAALRQAQDYVSKKFRPHWRELYRAQKQETKFIERSTPMERAIFVFMNRERLGNGTPLTKRDMHRAISRPGRLLDLVDATHLRERTHLAQIQRVEERQFTGKILDDYARRHDALLSRQTDERQAERLQQFVHSRSITFNQAKQSLAREREAMPQPLPQRAFKSAPPPVAERAPEPPAPKLEPRPVLSQTFEQAADPSPPETPPPKLSPSEQLKRDMEEWRRKNPGRDFGREL